MEKFNRLITVLMMVFSMAVGPAALAADVQNANLTISGNVPAMFSMEIRSQAGELDLGLSSSVGTRVLALIHFRVNENLADFTLTPTTNAGIPRLAGAAAGTAAVDTWSVTINGSDGTAGTTCNVMKDNTALTFGAGLQAVHIGANALATTVAPAGNTAWTEGYDESCTLVGSWNRTGANAGKIPMAGLYSTTYTLVMTSV